MTDSQTELKRKKYSQKHWLTIVVVLVVVFGIGSVMLATQLNLVSQIVDFVRDLPFVGPDRIAALEDVYYNAQDTWDQFIYNQTHTSVVSAQIDASTATPTANTVTVTSARPITVTLVTPSAPPATPTHIPTPTPSTPAKIVPVIVSDPQAGEGVWVSDNLPLGDQKRPPLWKTFYRPDPSRPYSRVDLVWIDPTQTQINIVPGVSEPRAIDKIRGEGVIPPDVQSSGRLLAAWNGGFMTIHGEYGMMVNRRIVLPPRDGFATLAQYSDGRVRIGVWGEDIAMTPDLVTFRENGPILINHGVLNRDGLLLWGRSVSGETHIWRSGIGITTDGALIFAAGNALSAQSLGEALQRAGAVEAMQLDVNAGHVFFFTYSLKPEGLDSAKLNTAIPGPARLYLTPYARDFMYLTLNPTLASEKSLRENPTHHQ